jgi:hypothetical protein
MPFVLPRGLRPWHLAAATMAIAALLASTAHATATATASAGATATSAAPTAKTQCLVPGTAKPLDELWRPHMAEAIAYARSRTGDIAFAVRTSDGRFYGYRPTHDEWSASVVKAMLMVAYLDEPWIRGRALTAHDKSLLGPMITESDNDDAQIVFDTVGQGALRVIAGRVGMRHFATSPIWGETEITAGDQTRFFLHIDSYIVPRHRAYAMSLLAGIVPSERWGIGEVAPKGWKLYFKGGWGYGTGLLDHQVALLVRGCARVSIAVLTMYDGSHPYGKQTLKGIFERLLEGLPTGERRRPTDRGARIRTGDLKHPKLAR